MIEERRFAELAELLFDGELAPDEAAELRAHLESAPSAVAALRAAVRDQLLCRAALRPSGPGQLAERIQRVLDSWRPSSRQVAAQEVLARVDRRRRWAAWRRWGGLAAAALLVALALPAAFDLLRRPALPPDALAPRLVGVTGEVRLASGLALATGDRLTPGSVLTSGPGAAATLVWSDGTRIAIAAATTIERLPGAGQRLRLEQGTVLVRAAHRPDDQALEIVCPDAIAHVVGTAFSATVADGHARLAVSAGLVRWQRAADGVSSLVGAGQQATAADLPLPRAILLPAERIAAVREAIAAGREPWAGSWAALLRRVPGWSTAPISAPAQLEVTAYFPGNAQHTLARQTLYRLTEPALGLALAARLSGEERYARAALPWLRAATGVHPYADDSDTLICDTLAVQGLQAADLLRALPCWSAADGALIDAWIGRELAPSAERLRRSRSLTNRWRGLAATMSIAAWRGDVQAVRAAMDGLRADMATSLDRASVARMMGPVDDHVLFQALAHGLLCADIARVAAGDATAPPPEWSAAVADFVGGDLRTPPEAQRRFFHRALAGSAPWRRPDAARLVAGADPAMFCYGWYFPTLMARDPRDP